MNITLMSGALWLLLLPTATVAAEGQTHGGDFYPLVLAIAAALAVVHVVGTPLRRLLCRHERVVRSVGGGMAIAYVFLMLLPELERGHAVVGDSIHILVLTGFLFFLSLELWFQGGRAAAVPQHGTPALFRFHVGLGWFYSWTVVYALPEVVGVVGIKALISTAALGLHMLYKDYVLGVHEPGEFDVWARFALAAAPLTGWLAAVLIPPSEATGDILIAFLAGYLLQNVFRNEIPEYRESRLGWFVMGALFYSVPVMIYRSLV